MQEFGFRVKNVCCKVTQVHLSCFLLSSLSDGLDSLSLGIKGSMTFPLGSLEIWEDGYLEDLLGPGPERLLLPTELIPFLHFQDPLSSQLFQEGVHSMSKGTEVRVCPWAKAKHREPANKTTESTCEVGLRRCLVLWIKLCPQIHVEAIPSM